MFFFGIFVVSCFQMTTLLLYSLVAPANEEITLKKLLSHACNINTMMIMLYLKIVCSYQLLHPAYYVFVYELDIFKILFSLLVLDCFMSIIHIDEHVFFPTKLYQLTHGKHHHIRDPEILDAYNASWSDTLLLVILPLHLTLCLIPMNMLELAIFGGVFSSHFLLIHARYDVFRGRLPFIGTSSHHREHHKDMRHNFSHFTSLY